MRIPICHYDGRDFGWHCEWRLALPIVGTDGACDLRVMRPDVKLP